MRLKLLLLLLALTLPSPALSAPAPEKDNELATSIDRAEPVTVALGIGAALFTVGGVTLMIVDGRSSATGRQETAVSSSWECT